MNAQEKFRQAIDFSLKWEGGQNFTIVNGKPIVKGAAKNDAGGATAFGIIIPTLKAAYSAGIVSHQDYVASTALSITAALRLSCRGQSMSADSP